MATVKKPKKSKSKQSNKPKEAKAPQIDLPQLVSEIKDHWQEAIDTQRVLLDHSHEIGLRLISIRDSMPGEFKAWCESASSGLPFGYRQAKNLVRIAEPKNWKLIESERTNHPNKSIKSGLTLLRRAMDRANGIDPDAPRPKGGGTKRWRLKVTDAQVTEAMSKVGGLSRSQVDGLLKALKIKVA